MRIAAFFEGAISAVICILLLSPVTNAWSNGGYSADQGNPDYGTHDWIMDRALEIQTRNVDFLKATYHSFLLLGTEAPDNPEFIGDTVNHHVYFYESGELQSDGSAARATSLYTTALEYLVAGDYDNAAFDIGAMSHYIADPGVFGHTMGAYTDWGAETHHSDYENEIESMIGSLPAPVGITLGNSDAYAATVGLAEDTTFGDGAIQSNTWMDTNYNWEDDTFTDSAMASLRASVAAVASVLNHMMVEAESSNPPPSAEAPQPPASLSSSVTNAEATLTWTAPTDDGGSQIFRYLIYRSTDPEQPSYVDSVAGDVRTWTDDSVKEGTTYYYWVVAENSVGRSEMVRVTSATIPEDQTVLLMAVLLAIASAVIALTVALLWPKKRRMPRHPP